MVSNIIVNYTCVQGNLYFFVELQQKNDGRSAFGKDCRSMCESSLEPSPMKAFRAWMNEQLSSEEIDELLGFDPNEPIFNPYGFEKH